MDQLRCVFCGMLVSTKTENCPHCGQNSRNLSREKPLELIIRTGLVLYASGRRIPFDLNSPVNIFAEATFLGGEFYKRSFGIPNEYREENYYKGYDVIQEISWIEDIYKMAIENGNEIAEMNLGIHYFIIALKYELGLDLPVNTWKAVEYYEKSVLFDFGIAKEYLGILLNKEGIRYLKGEGVTKDLSKASYLFDRAVELGDENALNNLGILYYELGKNSLFGFDTDIDHEKAFVYLKKAINLGVDQAQIDLEFLEGLESLKCL